MKLLLALCFATFVSSVSLRALDPVLPVIAGDFGITLREAALLASAYALPYALMQLVFGPAGDAFGRSRLIRISVAMVGLGSAICAAAPDFAVALGARIIAGSFAGGIIPVCLALIGDRTAVERRQVALSRIMVASIIGQMSGAVGSGLLGSVTSWRVIFIVTAFLAALAWLGTLRYLDNAGEMRSRFTFGQAMASYRLVLSNPVIFLVCGIGMCEGLLLFGVFPFVTPLLASHGPAGPVEGGITLAAFAIGGVLYGLIVRHLVTALGQRGMMRTGSAVAGIAYMAAAAPLHWMATAALFLVAGFGFYMLHNTLQMLTTEVAPKARGAAFAIFASALFLGQGLGPIAAGALASLTGFSIVFFCAGALLVLVVASTAHLAPR